MKYKFEKQKGKILKPCPGQKGYVCCSLFVIETAMGCPFSCSYCAIQEYIQNKNIIFYKGIEKLENELKDFDGIRITTGEFSDSLGTENFYPYLKKIYKMIKGKKITLELKTKSTNIKPILNLKTKKQLICGFSLNSKEVYKKFEANTPDPISRIKAAKELEENGFYLSFHFDPIISSFSYEEVIEKLTNTINEKNVLWISLGVLRFPEKLYLEFLNDKEKWELVKGEYFQGKDKKFRLYRPLREDVYRKIIKKIREKWKDVFIYFCMENRDVWKNVFGFEMDDNKLKNTLDKLAKKVL